MDDKLSQIKPWDHRCSAHSAARFLTSNIDDDLSRGFSGIERSGGSDSGQKQI